MTPITREEAHQKAQRYRSSCILTLVVLVFWWVLGVTVVPVKPEDAGPARTISWFLVCLGLWYYGRWEFWRLHVTYLTKAHDEAREGLPRDQAT